MLKPAQLYKEELEKLFLRTWYDLKYMFYSGWTGSELPTMSADNFGIISFGNHIEFARDVYKVICDLFEKHGMNRVSWSAFVENPAVKGYRNFIKKHGGRECAYHRQVAKLLDGKLHDDVEFEILACEFKK